MNNELIERIDIELTGLQSVLDGAKAAMPYERFAEISSPMDVLRDCKAALNKCDTQQQRLIGSRARLQIEIAIAESLIDDPNYEMSAIDCEYWNAWHDKLKSALTRQQEAKHCWQPIDTAPKDNSRPLYLAAFRGNELVELDFNGGWESESWEMPQVYFYWASENGIEEPTHWAYQDEPLPADAAQPQVPDGYVLVPIRPLETVLRISDREHEAWDAVKAAMLSAHKEQS